MLGKQWILYYTQVTTWGNIVDRGKERQAKLLGHQKWGLRLILDFVPVMLQFALFLFGAALSVYLWDLDVSVAEVVLVATSFGFGFYVCITVAAMLWVDCPFHTPLSVLLPEVLRLAKVLTAPFRSQRWWKRRITSFLPLIERLTEHGHLTNSFGRVFKIFSGGTTPPPPPDGDTSSTDYPMTLSNRAFWRDRPLFTSPIPKDIAASAGSWLLENSTDFSVTAAVAAVFSEFQWPSRPHSSTALIRLRDMYVECLRVSESTRLRALQSAAAYYVLYHTQLIWNTWKRLEAGAEIEELPSGLPPDLFLRQHNGEWNRDNLFEYLLHIEDRSESEPVKSARFLSYIAPYWFCGDTDSAIMFRPNRLQTLNELIEVLEKSWALTPATVTNCILCAGATMDFPLHPEDLVRVDKRCVPPPCASTVGLTGGSDYFAPTFKLVVEHIHAIALTKGRRHSYAKTALEILVTLVEKTSFLLVDAAWINDLLERAAWGKMDDELFTTLLRLSAFRKEDDAAVDPEIPPGPGQDIDCIQQGEADPLSPGGTMRPEDTTPQYTLFDLVLRNVKTCSEQKGGWQDNAVYGGLTATGDIPGLRSYLPKDEFLETLSKAMEKSEENKGKNQGETKVENQGENQGKTKGDKPFRVRKAAYDVVLAAQDGWLKSPDLRKTLERLDFPKKLHSVAVETSRSDHQCSFLEMMEILSEDRFWHAYLRREMGIWLPLHREGPVHALRILTNVGELLLPRSGDSDVDKSLEKALEEEWAAVPGRLLTELTVDLLGPLAEVTKQFKELSFFSECDQRAVLGRVELVIPRLEERREGGYSGLENDIRGIIDDLLAILREPVQSSSRRITGYW